jgi:hypothetical protein
MSKKAVFFDISRKHVKGANMWASVADPHQLHGLRATFVPRDEGERRRPLQNRSAANRRAEEAQRRIASELDYPHPSTALRAIGTQRAQEILVG